MPDRQLSLQALPAWAALNDVTLLDTRIDITPGRGWGLIAEKRLTTAEETFDMPALLTVPHELILDGEAVEEYAKEDRNFRLLLDAASDKVLLLFRCLSWAQLMRMNRIRGEISCSICSCSLCIT